MPLPAARLAPAHVGSTGNQRPCPETCSDPQVSGMFWRGELMYRKIRAHHVQRIQRRDVQGLPQKIIAAPLSRQKNGSCARQRPISPRHHAGTPVEEISRHPDIAVLAAIQSATRTNRTSMETRKTHRHPQSILCHPERSAPGGRILLRPLAEIQPSAAQVMRHYLRRYV